MRDVADPVRRVRRWFWALVLVAVLSMGALYGALGARTGPTTGLAVAASSLVLLAATAQAVRILLALDRVRRRAESERPRVSAGPASTPATALGATTGRARSFDRLFGRRVANLGEAGRR